MTDEFITLQRIITPDSALATDEDIYWRRTGGVSHTDGVISIERGHGVNFETWMNMFHLGHWRRKCHLDGLWLRLKGRGQVLCEVVALESGVSVWRGSVDLGATGDADIDLSHLLTRRALDEPVPERQSWMPKYKEEDPPGAYMPCVRFWAETDTVLDSASFVTRATHARDVRLALGITTFRREQAVTTTADRLEAYFASEAGAETAARTHVNIIDNGRSVALADTDKRRVIPNPNLGGAGGFSRALVAAEDGGFSHVLFMDDDASFPMESLARTLAFLRLARDDKTAIAGAMITEDRPYAMWEYGAVFHQVCHPQFCGVDLRDRAAFVQMEFHASDPKPENFYAGWWYFAFPIAHVKHYPYPFFVRGDDISFSLAHQFQTLTLNGVMSFQEGFAAKENPQVHYLDLRQHLHHHLVHDDLEIGAVASGRTAFRFILRSLLRMHYASAQAQCQSWEDLMQGPAFFEANADMAEKRAEIAAYAQQEAWVADADLQTHPGFVHEPSYRYGRTMKWLLNGHLVPFWSVFARRVKMPAEQRMHLWALWGVCEAEFIEAGTTTQAGTTPGRSYRVSHDKRRFFTLLVRAIRLYIGWIRTYPDLQAQHRDGYTQLAKRSWWHTKFGGADQ